MAGNQAFVVIVLSMGLSGVFGHGMFKILQIHAFKQYLNFLSFIVQEPCISPTHGTQPRDAV